MRQQRPHNAGILVRQRHRGHVLVPPADKSLEPTVSRIESALCSADDGPSAVDQQHPQITIAPLADPEEGLPSAAGMLPRYQTEPSRQLPPVLETGGVADGGHQRAGGEGGNAWNLRQLPACHCFLVPSLYLQIKFGHLPVQFLQMLVQALLQVAKRPWQIVLAVFEYLR